MLYNIYNYSNQLIGQVEADNTMEAWSKAGKKYENILDVRPIKRGREITPSDLYSKIAGSFIKSEQLIEESWIDGSMNQVIEFHGFKLENDVERQIAFLQSFLKVIQRKRLEK